MASRKRTHSKVTSHKRHEADLALIASILNNVDQVVDLTSTADEDICDLTNVTASPTVLSDEPSVLILDTPTEGRVLRKRRRSGSHISSRPQGVAVDGDTDEELPKVLPSISSASVALKHDSVAESSEPSTSGLAISCPICFDSISQICARQSHLMATTCGHIFCKECIDDLFKTSARCQCPSCRKLINKKCTHRLFIWRLWRCLAMIFI